MLEYDERLNDVQVRIFRTN